MRRNVPKRAISCCVRLCGRPARVVLSLCAESPSYNACRRKIAFHCVIKRWKPSRLRCEKWAKHILMHSSRLVKCAGEFATVASTNHLRRRARKNYAKHIFGILCGESPESKRGGAMRRRWGLPRETDWDWFVWLFKWIRSLDPKFGLNEADSLLLNGLYILQCFTNDINLPLPKTTWIESVTHPTPKR